MKIKKIGIKQVFSALLICLLASTFILFGVGCNKPEEKDKSLFSFTGNVKISEKDYGVTLSGVNDTDFKLAITDIPVPLEGEYKFVEGKGYIFTFYDANDTVIKTKYSENKKEFYFYYDLDLGSAVGKGKVRLSNADEAFLAKWDRQDWGWPFAFYGAANDVLIPGNNCTMTINCKDDGTAVAIATSTMIAVPSRAGTWAYNAETKVYTFDVAGYTTTIYESTYDEAKNEWSVSMDFNIGMFLPLTATFTPAVAE